MYQYNDYVSSETTYGSAIAKFLVYRPDKKTIVVDFEGRIHEWREDTVFDALPEQIEEYFDAKIRRSKYVLFSLEESIKDIWKAYRNQKKESFELNGIIANLQDQVTSKSVMVELTRLEESTSTFVLSLEVDELKNKVQIKEKKRLNLIRDSCENRFTIKENSNKLRAERKVLAQLIEERDKWRNTNENR
jgi:hypothetical protein